MHRKGERWPAPLPVECACLSPVYAITRDPPEGALAHPASGVRANGPGTVTIESSPRCCLQ